MRICANLPYSTVRTANLRASPSIWFVLLFLLFVLFLFFSAFAWWLLLVPLVFLCSSPFAKVFFHLNTQTNGKKLSAAAKISKRWAATIKIKQITCIPMYIILCEYKLPLRVPYYWWCCCFFSRWTSWCSFFN